jgi:ribosomal protein S27E
MPNTSHQHECRRGGKCKNRYRDTEGHMHGAEIEDAGKLCRTCEEQAFSAIRKLGEDYEALAQVSANPTGTRAKGPHVKHTPGRAAPINLNAYELMARIDDELLRWAIRLDRELDNLPANPQKRVNRCLTSLSVRLGTLIDQPTHIFDALLPYHEGGDYLGREALDGVDAVIRLADYHRRAQRILGRTEAISYLTVEICHVCGQRRLIAQHDQNLISCRNCGHTWDEETFARLNNPLAA